MKSGRGGIGAARRAALAAILFACSAAAGIAGEAARASADVETVFFADPLRAPVRVVRGPSQSPRPPAKRWGRTEIVNFGDDRRAPVTVVHGGAHASAARPEEPPATRFETVSFADPQVPAVTIVRGIAAPRVWASIDLFDLAGGELDRIAFAVDGVESRHGGDPRMWRPEPLGPQGPMQVSAAAAFDVGGGDRFDLWHNRLLGRAYLAQMFRRYGNWADALAAYNWGPGNLDQWIAGGRSLDRLPLGVARYVSRVLRDAMITVTAGW